MPEFNIGDVVTLTKDGAEYGSETPCMLEVVPDFNRDNRNFFIGGATGVVKEVCEEEYGTKCLIRFDNDPVDDRMWWHWDDEIVKVVE